MLHTTFNKLREAGACVKGYRKLSKSMGGVDKYGADTPIPLTKIIESNGLSDTLWVLRCTIESSKKLSVEFACYCAEHVLHFYEDRYPLDSRPRKAIAAARNFITSGKIAGAAVAADAAHAASYATRGAASYAAAAAAAAADAARAASAYTADYACVAAAAYADDAAYDARVATYADAAAATEKEWQTKTLIKLLEA